MQPNRQYGSDDRQVKKLLEKYRQKPNSQLHTNQFPDYSAVKCNNQYEDMLAASEISWLDKMAEINDKVCDQTVYYGKDEVNVPKSANSMKFSFNQNYQTQAKEDEKKSHTNGNSKAEGHESLRDIYMKQLQKESQKIKEVQKARQQILNSIGPKKYATTEHNKEKQVESNSRNKSIIENSTKNQIKPSNKLSLGFESIELPKNIIIDKKKQYHKQQEMNSLRYLQESLAKTKRVSQRAEEVADKVQITKKNYLQQNSNVKLHNVSESNIQVKEFNEKEVIFTQLLQLIFDRVDKCNIGKLDHNNCDYERIEDVFKISFGSIFSRIKFKNLTMNRQQFVKIGLQIIKELYSQEFHNVIERTLKVNEKQQKQAKNKVFMCQKCQQKIDKVVSFSPEKPSYINQRYQNNIGNKENYPKIQSPVRNQILKNKSSNKLASNIERVSQEYKYKNYKDEKVSIEKQANLNPKYWRHMEQTIHLTKRQAMQNEKVMFMRLKKRRNISESMIEEHKRSLQDLVVLDQKMQNCVTASRKFTAQNHKLSQYSDLNLIPSYQFLQ